MRNRDQHAPRRPHLADIYVIVYATSIDEGDAWYFRVGPFDEANHHYNSDRLHVSWAERSSYPDLNWMDGVELVWSDAPGLNEREQMLADGWSHVPFMDPRDQRIAELEAELEAVKSERIVSPARLACPGTMGLTSEDA